MPSAINKYILDNHAAVYFSSCIILFALYVAYKIFTRQQRPDFIARPILTPNELEFFRRLSSALPAYSVFPQVAMSALLQPNLRQDDPNYIWAFRSFSQKVVDFVICDNNTLHPIAIVELDDCTHDSNADAARDAMLLDAGYCVLRWDSRNKPTNEEIREAIYSLT